MIKATRQNFPNRISRYAIGMAIAALPLAASAWDFTPDTTRILSDPAYLPLKGQIYGVTTDIYTYTTADVYNNLGVKHYSYAAKDNSLNQQLAYGVTDDLTVDITEAYSWHYTHDTYTSGNNPTTNSTGFIDPIFGVTWRALDQKAWPVNFDIIASYSPDWIDAKSASPEQDGNVARGGQVADIGAAVSYETRDFTIYGSAMADYLGNRDILNTDGTTTSYGSAWQYVAAVNTQTRFTDRFSLNLGINESFNNNSSGTNGSNGAAFTSSPGNVTEFLAALNYQFIPNRLEGSLGYNYYLYSDGTTTYPELSTSNSSTRNEDANVVTATLRYVFN